MLDDLRQAYQSRLVVRMVVYGLLLLCAVLLYILPGGFPPWAWRFLASLLPRLDELWRVQGTAMLLPLAGLILLSLSLLILWLVLLMVTLRLTFHRWREHYEQERFERELAEADFESERLAREVINEEYTEPVPTRHRTPPQEQAMYASAEEEEEERFSHIGERVVAREREQAPAIWNGYKVAQKPFPEIARKVPQADSPLLIPARPVAAPHGMEVPPWPGIAYMPPVVSQGASSLAQSHTSYGMRGATTDENERLQVARETPPAMRAHIPVEEPRPIKLARNAGARIGNASIGSFARRCDEEQGERVDWQFDESESNDDEFFEEEEANEDALDQEFGIEEYETRPVVVVEGEDEEVVSNGGSRELRLRLNVGMGLDPGIVRKDDPNEDNIFAMQGIRPGAEGPEPIGLFVVADGMGGHADGQEASRLAIQTIGNVVSPTLLREAELEEDFGAIIKDAAHRANLALYQRNRQQEHMMGTTLTAALVVGTSAYVVNVGDSRTYRYRASEGLTQITRDHSVVARLVENGIIEPEDVYTHPKRNQIYRCLGEHATVELDYFKVELQERDVLVLCSDGLWEMVRDPEIEQIIAEASTQASEISSQMVQAALSHGGADNISVVVSCLLPKGA
ncbi:PP2C family protein-serine/threonine phosphatase [Ktedonospora formicarum]|uniref:PPM-type phosphatase domain-containing protein n=1 Tax=Ktedonospora formicarum TaxID=2778364 RepID=A0A8J3MRT1_9CHLR|nr:protein phosphatase 2C domain-containing protein [Ktedonospora formicarum]GHO46422.1 hypothetical protein KSX_45850 [Ktedonospora formicarum]